LLLRTAGCRLSRDIGGRGYNVTCIQTVYDFGILAIRNTGLYHFFFCLAVSGHDLNIIPPTPAGDCLVRDKQNIASLFGCNANGDGKSLPQPEILWQSSCNLTLLLICLTLSGRTR